MAIKKEFIVSLRGKEYPLYAGVLDAATEAGLRSLTTQVVQIPTAENGMLAVVTARAEFEDGRVFEDVGDCSPQSTSPHLAAAALRLASTRAKGRVLRDSVNVGQTMFEELPDMDGEVATGPARTTPTRVQQPSESGSASRAPQRPADSTPAARSADAASTNGQRLECSAPGCGKQLTRGQADVSTRGYGQMLCPEHQKSMARLAQ